MAPLEGPVGVGALIDAITLGCVIVQSCVYYKNSRGDAWLLKVLCKELMEIHKVSLVLLLLFSHLGCMAAWLWASVEGNTGDASVPDSATILFGVSSVCGATILFLERCFFSHRIMKASDNHMLAFVFFVWCIFSFTAALGGASVFFTNGTADLTSQLDSSWIFPLVIFSGLVCDLATNIATAVYLRSETPTEAVDALGRVTRLLLFAAETGIMASLFDVAAVIVYWSTKTNLAWVGLFVLMPGMFANTFLAALNARGHLCADIEHQRVKINDKLINGQGKRPPIKITISEKVGKLSENSPV